MIVPRSTQTESKQICPQEEKPVLQLPALLWAQFPEPVFDLKDLIVSLIRQTHSSQGSRTNVSLTGFLPFSSPMEARCLSIGRGQLLQTDQHAPADGSMH